MLRVRRVLVPLPPPLVLVLVLVASLSRDLLRRLLLLLDRLEDRERLLRRLLLLGIASRTFKPPNPLYGWALCESGKIRRWSTGGPAARDDELRNSRTKVSEDF
jgi:hypothetical protein